MKTNLKLYQSGAQGATRLLSVLSIFTMVFLLINSGASAQTKTITGVIRDEQQQALAGASVSVKGTSQGVLTDTDGRFSLTVQANEKTMLVFSYMGKKTVDLSVADRTHFEITLYEDFMQITEVVVLGAGGDDELYSETKPAKKSFRKAKKGSR